ncbi:hypothetical protein JMUB3933_1397 [Leptotrichia wadei]|uniref:Uncharacterized protein n=1 Tax=Leptotrichia wadei TaxID=157687 RepID=A0A510K8C0_9FUSO|nr:hypothetical protein JMUB3933_1397 [Leptotrichia wadei]
MKTVSVKASTTYCFIFFLSVYFEIKFKKLVLNTSEYCIVKWEKIQGFNEVLFTML